MYKIPKQPETSIRRNESVEGESIEKAIQRMKNNNETELTTKDLIYTRPEDGVVYGTDIRGDKFDRALEKTNKVTEHMRMTRQEKYEERKRLLEEKKAKKLEAKNASKGGNEQSIQASPQQPD